MRYTYEMIVEKLKLYPTMQEKLKLLRFELGKVARISEDEVMTSLAYGCQSCEKISSGNAVHSETLTIGKPNYKTEKSCQFFYEAALNPFLFLSLQCLFPQTIFHHRLHQPFY